MKDPRNIILLILLGASLVSCYPTKKSAFKDNPKVKNVIYMIGDGMGLAHIYAAMTVSGKPLNIERCEATGLQKTDCANRYITDSAAGGTALATGNKTNYGSVGVALDFARDNGRTLVVITADHETGGVTITGGDRQNKNVQLEFSTIGHSAVMVPVYSYGPGSGKFTGIYENTDLFKKILASFKFKKLN